MAREPIADQCYVLHRHAWKESSFILRVLTAEHGYLGLVARGLRGGKRQAPVAVGVPCDLVFRMGRELGQVIELRARVPQWSPRGEAWWALQYLHELLINALVEQDPCPELFQLYDRTLAALRRDPASVAAQLRCFEYGLLHNLGLGFDAGRDAHGAPVQAEALYGLVPEVGLRRIENDSGCRGADWLSLMSGELDSAAAARLRQALQGQLALQIDFSRLKSRGHWQQARRLAQQHQNDAAGKNKGAQ